MTPPADDDASDGGTDDARANEAGPNDAGADDGEEADGDVDPADAFGALSDPLRVEILRELSAHHREAGRDDPFQPPDPVGFAELRKRVGVRDSGRFRYHLEELRGRFVEKVDDSEPGSAPSSGSSSGGGYRLTHAGVEVVAAVVAGTYTDEVSLGAAELDSDCPTCGGPAVASYRGGVCWVTCPEDHPVFAWDLPPNAAAGVSPSTAVERAELLAVQGIECSLAGVCPKCHDAIETSVDVEGSPRPTFRAACDGCGSQLAGPVGFCLLVDPEVAAFYRQHGRALDEQRVWEPSFVHDGSATTVVDDDPVRVRIEVTLDGETLLATVDGTGTVTAVDRRHGTG